MRSAKGSIRRRGPNRWWVSIPGPIDPETGKRTEIGEAVRGSRVDAAVALARLLGDGLPDETTWDAFWSAVVQPSFANLAEGTVDGYERLWRVELRHRIGHERVADMTWTRANEVLTSIHAPSVQRHAGALLKKMCNMAIRDSAHLLTVNPVDRAIEYAPTERRRKRLVLSEDVAGFLSAVEGIKYEPLLLCELGAGLRPEEARALLWEDVSEFELKGVAYAALEVDKALAVVHNRGVFKSTKNEASARTAVMGEPFASRLLALSDGRSGPLCPSGRPYDPERPEAWYTSPVTIAHNWKQWCRRNGVPHVADKEMRASYATMMGEAGAPDSVVSGNMGHAGDTTKTRHYQRVTMRAKCMAADLLAESLEDFR
jgi:integrase